MGSALHVLVATLAVVLGALCITPRGVGTGLGSGGGRYCCEMGIIS